MKINCKMIEFFFNNIIKIRKSKYNYHDKIVNNLTYMCARRVNLYSLERGNQGLSNEPKIA